MIEIFDKAKCCGCTACANVCPRGAIKMIEDEEGFKYPYIDKKKCIKCELCDGVCPMKDAKCKSSNNSTIYACQTKNEEIRSKSTSGGSFYVLASEIVKNNGIVYAATYDDDNMEVIHKGARYIPDLEKMCGSKYVQSNLSYSFKEIKQIISKGQLVLFVGTPCQVNGLINLIGNKGLEYLYTAELVCYGVPSPGIYKKWIDYIEKKYNNKIININFRDKKYGYFGTNVKIYFKDGKVLEDCRDAKIFLKTMFSHIGLRPTCYNCPFRNYTRKCDFTLGDFWEIGSYSKKLDDNKGTTKITIYTEKGKRLFESANKNSDFIAIDEDISIKEKNMKIPKSRNEFFIDAKKIDFEENMKKYFHVEKKDFIANNIKPLVIHIPGIKLVIKMLRLKSIKRNLSRKD